MTAIFELLSSSKEEFYFHRGYQFIFTQYADRCYAATETRTHQHNSFNLLSTSSSKCSSFSFKILNVIASNADVEKRNEFPKVKVFVIKQNRFKMLWSESI